MGLYLGPPNPAAKLLAPSPAPTTAVNQPSTTATWRPRTLTTGLATAAQIKPSYTENGLYQIAPPAVQTASYTGAAAGGAPGAQFGPPGTGGAPTTIGGIAVTPGLLIGAGLVALGIYLVLR